MRFRTSLARHGPSCGRLRSSLCDFDPCWQELGHMSGSLRPLYAISVSFGSSSRTKLRRARFRRESQVQLNTLRNLSDTSDVSTVLMALTSVSRCFEGPLLHDCSSLRKQVHQQVQVLRGWLVAARADFELCLTPLGQISRSSVSFGRSRIAERMCKKLVFTALAISRIPMSSGFGCAF